MRPLATALALASTLLVSCMSSQEQPRERTPSPPPTYDVPIALVVALGSDVRDLDEDVARQLVRDGATNWSELGQDDGSLDVVTAGVSEAGTSLTTLDSAADAVDEVAGATDGAADEALAIVPATAVTPRVHALAVGGTDPLRTPEDYPLLTQAENEPGKVVTTTIAGDVMLGRRVGAAMERAGDLSSVWRPLAERLASADITVANFESTLSKAGSPTQGGDSFGADPAVLDGLDLAGLDVISLANNHLGDYGPDAIDETVDELLDNDFDIVGGGKDLDQASAPAIVESSGIRIGFIATDSIGETPSASSTRGGTNRINAPPRTGPLDREALDRVAGDISDLDERVDIVIAMPHWGTQYTNAPEESQREISAAFAEAGADLVVGGHPHWVQGWETIEDTTVVHSLGNFIFDMDFMRETQEGIFLEVVSWGDTIVGIQPVPYVIGDDFAPEEASTQRADTIFELIRETSDAPYDRLTP